jgi:hypothetical protein
MRNAVFQKRYAQVVLCLVGLVVPWDGALGQATEKVTQFEDGRIVFPVAAGKLEGKNAKLGGDPGEQFIGPFKDSSDWASWDYKPTRWGNYYVELTYMSTAALTEISVDLSEKGSRTTMAVQTNAARTYQTQQVGSVYVQIVEPLSLRLNIKAVSGKGEARIKSITFKPAPEGRPILQEGSGPILLLAKDAITHSVAMRYEPSEKKNCLGFWTNPHDWAEWEFELKRSGVYAVELSHGCGKGSGGSDVVVEVARRELPFVVQDTGDFHIHATNRLGEVRFEKAGKYSLAVKPRNKKGVAVMDVEFLRLVLLDK